MDDNVFFSFSVSLVVKWYGLKLLNVDYLGLWVVVGILWMKYGCFWRGLGYLNDVIGMVDLFLVKGWWMSILILSDLVDVGIKMCWCWCGNMMDFWGKIRFRGEIKYFDRVKW